MKSKIKEKPILFNAEMIRALLEGRKSQTRRVIKNQPDGMDSCYIKDFRRDFGGRKCPYGQVGDQLWVREKFRTFCPYSESKEIVRAIEYSADAFLTRVPVFKPPLEIGEGCLLDQPSP